MKEQFSFTGRVIEGHHLGHTLGFPTANIVVTPGEKIPALGVYAAWVTLPDGTRHAAVTNLGVRPTVEEAGALWVESYLLDFSGDLYGQELTVTLCHFLRPERRFPGVEALRQAIAAHLRQFRGMAVGAEQIIVGAGTEVLYNLLVQLLGRDRLYGVEDPGYSKAARIYALGGARTAPVLVDEGGVSLRSLEMSGAQILHTSPNHQFPTGAVTPIGRRQSLLRWAEAREGRYIIEDDYDSEFRFTLRPIPTLQSIDRAGHVIYVNTFSRTLAPSLRISYMVLPKSLTERYRAQLGFYSSTVPAMEQHTLARFLDEGYFEAHINRMRKSYRAQRDAVIDTILQSPLGEHCRVSGEDAGLHFLLTIDTKYTDHVLRADAEGRGVRLSFLSDFALRPGSAPQHTLVIHYPGIDLGRLRSALSILEALLYFRDWKYKGRK